MVTCSGLKLPTPPIGYVRVELRRREALVAQKLLADPFRVVFLSGGEATGTPAVLIPKPSGAARGALILCHMDTVWDAGTLERRA